MRVLAVALFEKNVAYAGDNAFLLLPALATETIAPASSTGSPVMRTAKSSAANSFSLTKIANSWWLIGSGHKKSLINSARKIARLSRRLM